MTSPAWPNEYEWDLWFRGKTDDAIKIYRMTLSHWYHFTDSSPPTDEKILAIFVNCITTKHRGLTPYQRFQRRRTERVYNRLKTLFPNAE